MDTPTTLFLPAKVRVYRKRRPGRAVAPLTLVSAAYDKGASVTLTFDRAIDITGVDVGTFTVDDGSDGLTYLGDGTPVLEGPMTVRVDLTVFGDFGGTAVHLAVGPGNGVAPADGGESWEGVTDLELPFP